MFSYPEPLATTYPTLDTSILCSGVGVDVWDLNSYSSSLNTRTSQASLILGNSIVYPLAFKPQTPRSHTQKVSNIISTCNIILYHTLHIPFKYYSAKLSHKMGIFFKEVNYYCK